MELENPLVKTLQHQFALRQQKLKKYSLRTYAKDLKIAVSTLSEIMTAKRLPSTNLARRLIVGLNLDAGVTRALLDNVEKDAKAKAGEKKSRRMKFVEVSAQTVMQLQEWHHFAILSLVKTVGFKDDEKWIANRLGISAAKAQSSLELLEQVGLIAKDKQKKWRRTQKNIMTSDNVSSTIVRNMQLESLRLAKISLQTDALDTHDFVSMSLAADPRRIAQARAMTRRFLEKVTTFLEGGEKREVYRVSVNIFPVSRNS